MNATAEYPARSLFLLNVRPGVIDWGILGQICICVIPAMSTLDFATPLLGARYMAASLAALLGYHFIRRDRYRYLSLLIGAGPALSLLRGVFFYDSIFIFMLGGVILWAYQSWKEVQFLWQDPIWKSLAIFCILYWAISVGLRGTFGANIRALEFALTAAAICLLANRRSFLATGLIGVAISATAYAVAMLPYGARLGEGEVDSGETIGNPALMGLPSALIVLLALTDRGRYLLLESKFTARLILCMVVGQWLILSGSRGSWLITISGLIIVFCYSQPSRKAILAAIAVGCIATIVMLGTERGAKVTNVFDRTVDSNRSLGNRTSGRSEMWKALPEIFAVSPVWGWGPGSGADVDYIYTHRHLIFHSLYEQIIVECGLLGFIPLMWILIALLIRTIKHFRKFDELTPLVGIVGFMLIGMSVTAFDFVSGVFFGLALTARSLNQRVVSSEFMITPMEEDEVITV